MLRGRRCARAAAAVAGAALLLSGCVAQGLAFKVDRRVHITSPKDRSEVSLPVTVAWTVHDFTGTYAVFVDRTPQPPGKPLSWLARDDRSCHRSAGCPDADYFATRGIYQTDQTHLTFEQLPRLSTGAGQKERHHLTVVLLDDAGHRVGESAFEVEFTVRRKDTL